jgi:hypothetical protein
LTLCHTLPASAEDEISGTWGELSWTLNETTGELMITGEGMMDDFPNSNQYAWRKYASKIHSVTIQNGVTSIGKRTFKDCSQLAKITIPESVTEMGSSAFEGCSNLKEVYCYNFSQEWNDAFDESLVGDITLHVPEHALDYVQKSFKKIVPLKQK